MSRDGTNVRNLAIHCASMFSHEHEARMKGTESPWHIRITCVIFAGANTCRKLVYGATKSLFSAVLAIHSMCAGTLVILPEQTLVYNNLYSATESLFSAVLAMHRISMFAGAHKAPSPCHVLGTGHAQLCTTLHKWRHSKTKCTLISNESVQLYEMDVGVSGLLEWIQ